jgi:hypothetical protein
MEGWTVYEDCSLEGAPFHIAVKRQEELKSVGLFKSNALFYIIFSAILLNFWLCCLFNLDTNIIKYIFNANKDHRPPLWSSGQSSWLQIQRSRVPFLALPDFLRRVGLERGPLSLVRITEELLEWKSNGSGQENLTNDRGDPLRWPRDTLYQQKLALISPISGGRSVGIVRLRTKGHGILFFNKDHIYMPLYRKKYSSQLNTFHINVANRIWCLVEFL